MYCKHTICTLAINCRVRADTPAIIPTLAINHKVAIISYLSLPPHRLSSSPCAGTQCLCRRLGHRSRSAQEIHVIPWPFPHTTAPGECHRHLTAHAHLHQLHAHNNNHHLHHNQQQQQGDRCGLAQSGAGGAAAGAGGGSARIANAHSAHVAGWR